ncbi:MAG: HPr kinase/phosphorylase, partial [Liquorilactobacillus ghanensis]
MSSSVSVADLVAATGTMVFSGGKYLQERMISTSDISRPGLELTGYFA